ncbi:hypothetical protein B0T11DRAFT_214973, partial [Plectosphaerella cucumerina]
PPKQPSRGWAAGISRSDENDLVLCLQSGNTTYRVRRTQAILQIHSTGRFYIQSASTKAITYISGDRVYQRPHVLNDVLTSVTFGALRYRAEYTRFAQSDSYASKLREYLQTYVGVQISSSMLALTPTPSENRSIKIGRWTTTSGTISTGASGRVSVGIDQTGKTVALKRMTIGLDKKPIIDLEAKLEALTALAVKHKEERILRLVEIITDNTKATNKTADV